MTACMILCTSPDPTAMVTTTRSARVTGPVLYTSKAGRKSRIPLGPCLVEHDDSDRVDIIWGVQGQRCAVLPRVDVEAAEAVGHLVLLD
jgi:hypothetical protein